MNRLKITTRTQAGRPDLTVLDLQGVLDESTLDVFSAYLATLPANLSIWVLNFAPLRSANAFAAGFVTGLAATVGAPRREIRLVGVPEDLKRAFGATAASGRLRFYADEAAALSADGAAGAEVFAHHFAVSVPAEPVSAGLPFPIRVEARDSSDRPITGYAGLPHAMSDRGMIAPTLLRPFAGGVWSGEMILTGTGTVRVRVWDDFAAGEAELQVAEQGEKVEFPVQVACPGCGKSTIAGKSDIFRCVKCNFIYFIDPRGRQIPLKSGGRSETVKTLEFHFPSDINYLNHVRNFIVGVSREENISEEKISQIEMSLDEALANVVEHAYTFDSHQEIRVRVAVHADRLEIVIRDHGRTFNSDKTPLPNIKEHIEQRRVGGLGRYLMKTLMDEVEYRSDAHTNELRMMKRF